MEKQTSDCAQCPYKSSDRICRTADGKSPPSCPTVNQRGLIEASLKEYQQPAIYEFARQAAIQEAEGYGNKELGYEHVRPIKTRIEELIEFAGRMKYKKIGLAFCMGLNKEAAIVGKLIESKGFEVASAVCKAGRVPKEAIGVTDEQKVSLGKFETMCNPILQAMILNDEKTEFNVLLGLCIGHDSLFIKYGQAPCTVLAVKDRVLGHNPLAAVYCFDSYYRSLK